MWWKINMGIETRMQRNLVKCKRTPPLEIQTIIFSFTENILHSAYCLRSITSCRISLYYSISCFKLIFLEFDYFLLKNLMKKVLTQKSIGFWHFTSIWKLIMNQNEKKNKSFGSYKLFPVYCTFHLWWVQTLHSMPKVESQLVIH